MSGPKAVAHLPEAPLGELERLVERALERGSPVLGYGEISLVLGWPADAPAFDWLRASRESAV